MFLKVLGPGCTKRSYNNVILNRLILNVCYAIFIWYILDIKVTTPSTRNQKTFWETESCLPLESENMKELFLRIEYDCRKKRYNAGAFNY